MQERHRVTVWLVAMLVLGTPAVALGQVDDEEEAANAVPDEPAKEEPPVKPKPAKRGYAAVSTPTPGEEKRGAEDFEGAPAPTEAAGTIVSRNKGASFGRKLGRVLLFVPRWTAEVLFAPIRLGLWTYNRYQVETRFKSIFFNDDGTVGLFPVAFFETGFGLNIGARFILRNLFRGDGKFQARVSYGGRFRQLYSAKLATGRIFKDRVELELDGAFQIFSKSRFVGIGNDADLTDFAVGDSLIDPINDDTAVKTRYRHDDVRVGLTADVKLVGDLSLRLSNTFIQRSFNNDPELVDDDFDIREVYEQGQLVGFDDGLASIYPEIELVYDSRRRTSVFHSAATSGTGWKLAGFFGWSKGVIDEDPADFFRYGVDVQRHLNLYNGDRFLILRGYLEAVTGDIADVPFVELPRLGGPTFLRGYDRDRFRDRIATLYSAEYNYPMAGNLSAFVFTDFGRVYRDYDSVTDQLFDEMHIGFGGGIQGHTKNTFIMRASLYSSIDGDVFFTLSFDPVFDTRSREETP